ncbi:hypothetical protein C1878_05875 [Gordonibacter sp. 28C]|nr:hypothetical protein C1878_05875 [Gordonibacter sp. 28C]
MSLSSLLAETWRSGPMATPPPASNRPDSPSPAPTLERKGPAAFTKRVPQRSEDCPSDWTPPAPFAVPQVARPNAAGVLRGLAGRTSAIPPSPTWPGCAVGPRRSRAPRRSTARTAAAARWP